MLNNLTTASLTTAQRITKYWTDTYCEEQFNLAKKQCVKQNDNMDVEGWVHLVFEDDSELTFYTDGSWEMFI